MIILSQTYSLVTPESAEHGDTADHGFDWEDVAHSFRDTVNLILDEGFLNPSDSHGVPRWLSTDPVQDFGDGSDTTYSLHPASDARSQRYWAKACRAAGICK